jgi:hypothetical protein
MHMRQTLESLVYVDTYLPVTYPPATRIICISQSVDAALLPFPYIMTSSHIRSTSHTCHATAVTWPEGST